MVDNLLALQELELHSRVRAPEIDQQINTLRKHLPESMLGNFDRWIKRQKKAVATVRDGVCRECHIRIAVGVLADLAMGDKIEHCGNCGRILYLPSDEPICPQPSGAAGIRLKPPLQETKGPAKRKKELLTHAS